MLSMLPDTFLSCDLRPIFVCAAVSVLSFLVGMLVGTRFRKRRRQKSPRQRSQRQPGEAEPRGRRVEMYVGNLSYDIKDGDLAKIFSKYGTVSQARVIQNKFNGKSKGYGFVSMSNGAECKAAVGDLNGKEVKGRKLVVNEARSKARD